MKNIVRTQSAALDQDAFAFLQAAKADILDQAIDRLEGEMAAGRRIADHISRNQNTGVDLLSLALRAVADPAGLTLVAIEPLLAKLRSPSFSIVNLFSEVLVLKELISEKLGAFPNLDSAAAQAAIVNHKLDAIFKIALEETSAVYEYAVESGRFGFCRLDGESRISYTNEQMRRLLGDQEPEGKVLTQYLDGGTKSGDQPLTFPSGEPVRVRRADGSVRTVHAHLEPIQVNDQRVGAYAVFADISTLIESDMKIFEQTPLGIIRIDQDMRITYANTLSKKMFGTDDLEGRTFAELIPDKENLNKLEQELAKRRKGRGTAYAINVHRLDAKDKPFPVEIIGIPVTDEQDEWIGSIGIFRDLQVETMTKNIHKHVETELDWHEMLSKVARVIGDKISYDLMTAVLYSSDGRHCSMFFSDPLHRLIDVTRWFPVSKEITDWMLQNRVEKVNDLEALVQQPPFSAFREDPTVRDMISRNLRSILRFAVFGENKPNATLTLFRYGVGGFSDSDVDLLKQLPIDRALQMALSHREREEFNFRFDLICEVASCQHIEDIPRLLTDQLQQRYAWPHASIYKVDRRRNEILLLSQRTSRNDHDPVPKGFRQSIRKGIIGYAIDHHSKDGLNIGDLLRDPEMAKKAHRQLSPSGPLRSVLCLPIAWDDRVRWVLYIDDRRENAFSGDEQRFLMTILDEVAQITKRLGDRYRLAAALQRTLTAVVVLDENNNVHSANPAACELLGVAELQGGKQPFDAFLADPIRSALRVERNIHNEEIELKRLDNGRRVEALTTLTRLPAELGGAVIGLQDLAQIRHHRELEALGEMAYELAIQAQTPLSLASSWLRHVEDADLSPDLRKKTVAEIRRRLCQVSTIFDRLALCQRQLPQVPSVFLELNLKDEIERLTKNFPEEDRRKIAITVEGEVPPLVCADPYQLAFVFETILSYLIRFRPKNKDVRVTIGRQDDRVSVALSGHMPFNDPILFETNMVLHKMRAEIALGERVILEFLRNNSGRYKRKETEDGIIQFDINFPAASQEQPQ